MRHIPAYQPTLGGRGREYVNDCPDSNWVSSEDHYIDRLDNSNGDSHARLPSSQAEAPPAPLLQQPAAPTHAARVDSTPAASPNTSEATASVSPAGPILIDGVFFQRYHTGIARVWSSLLRVWAGTEFGQRLIVLDRGRTAPRFEGLSYLDTPLHSHEAIDQDRAMLQALCDQHKACLFVSTHHSSPVQTTSVYVAHDMIPEMLGLDFVGKPYWRERRIAIEQASQFICVSRNTANDLVAHYPAVKDRPVSVTHCGVDFKVPPAQAQQAFLAKHQIHKRYLLIVGERAGYKNIGLFFRAFASLGALRSKFDIVCTGKSQALEPEFAALSSPARVHMLNLNDDELQCAYAGAHALVYPSRYEGFGLPILEAMACGCPVITCHTSSIPEVAGTAAVYVDPDDAKGLAAAIKRLQLAAERQRVTAAGLVQAQRFSWAAMAREMEAVLGSACVATPLPDETPSAVVPRSELLQQAIEHHQASALALAEPLYLQMLAQDANDFVALHMLGVLRFQQGRHDAAAELLEKALTINQLTPEAHYNLGNVFWAQKRLGQARAAFAQAVLLNPGFESAKKRLSALLSSL